jgi:hypothetical protein
VFVLTTTGWASSQWITEEKVSVSPVPQTALAEHLQAPLPKPLAAFVQKTDFGELGNVLVTVQLSPAELDAKKADGTAELVVIGNPESPVILRDDGQGGDATAGDGIFSAPASVDEADLSARETDDTAVLNSRTDKSSPRFDGRAAVGVETQQAFDYKSFANGAKVPLGPAVALLDPEGSAASQTSLAASHSSNKISSAAPVVPGTNPFQDRVLMIRDVGVVTDPGRTVEPCTLAGNPTGVWTFNHLMNGLTNPAATGIDPGDFVLSWLQNWTVNKNGVINGDPTLPQRTVINSIINQWPRLANGKLDLAQAPLRLLSINPRLDLRLTTGGGGPYSTNTSGNFLDAGEARFIFGFVAKPGWTGNFTGAVQIPGAPAGCRALPFTVIFEFRIPKCDCMDVRAWAQQWMDLNNFVPGSAAYDSRLEAITETFVVANANPRKPNGSALGQLRTNEVALTPPWELREFQLTQSPFTFLQETTVADTPEDGFNNNANGTGKLLNWIVNVIKPALLLGNEASIPPVPLVFSGGPFLAGNSQVPDGPGVILHHWNAPGLNINVTANPGNANILRENWARHRVSRAACNGCHRRETFTHFVHVDPASTIPIPPAPAGSTPALPAELSEFLTGINGLGDPADAAANGLPVNVAGNGNPKRNFDDLARREQDIRRIARMTCFRFQPVNAQLVRDSLARTGHLPADLFAGVMIMPVEGRVSVAVDDMTANHISEVH